MCLFLSSPLCGRLYRDLAAVELTEAEHDGDWAALDRRPNDPRREISNMEVFPRLGVKLCSVFNPSDCVIFREVQPLSMHPNLLAVIRHFYPDARAGFLFAR